MNWQRKHTRDNANCIVSIWDQEKQQWVEKEDTGTESFSEAEKGLASDSFKRACFNWGIGRELYTAPFIWVSKDNARLYKSEKTDKWTCYDKFKVNHIEYNDNKEITELSILNDNSGVIVFYYKANNVNKNERLTLYAEFVQLITKTETDREKICKHYKVEKTDDLSIEQLKDAINTMKKKVK